jgi:hypothetical protein
MTAAFKHRSTAPILVSTARRPMRRAVVEQRIDREMKLVLEDWAI